MCRCIIPTKFVSSVHEKKKQSIRISRDKTNLLVRNARHDLEGRQDYGLIAIFLGKCAVIYVNK